MTILNSWEILGGVSACIIGHICGEFLKISYDQSKKEFMKNLRGDFPGEPKGTIFLNRL